MPQPELADSHTHLNLLQLEHYGGSLQAVLESARVAGVTRMLCAAVDLESMPVLRGYARELAGVAISAGVHPNHAPGEAGDADALRREACAPEVVAVGETGLDYFRSSGDLAWQHERFRQHIAVARELDKPLIIHSRDAREDTLRVLGEEGADAVGGVMHCFVEDWSTARRAMDLGFYISLSGIVTFRSARELQEVARRIPLDRLLIETDAPYLAPVPHRGKPNQPSYVRHVAQFIADLRDCDLDDVAEASTANYRKLFRVE